MLGLDRQEFLKDYATAVDFSLLSPLAKIADIKKHCNIALKHHYYAVCLNPINIAIAKKYLSKELLKDIKVCAVVGYPLGESVTAVKIFEAKMAFADGADEIDLMISVSRIKSGDYAYVKNEISRIVRIAKKKVVKVIIEIASLNRDEINKVLKICCKCKVDFVQTSSGYVNMPTSCEEVDYIARNIKGKCAVKASGGITNKQDAINMIRAGASRIGTSRIV